MFSHEVRPSSSFHSAPIDENLPFVEQQPRSLDGPNFSGDEDSIFGMSSTSADSWENPLKPLDGFLAARHVFLTLKQAVMNSVLIIAIGSIGFHYIENLNFVDAFYFTTVLLTTVGYGDITPKTDQGKMFATIYVLVAGTVLLHNMSLISMIPLELRKRRIEREVLLQVSLRVVDIFAIFTLCALNCRRRANSQQMLTLT